MRRVAGCLSAPHTYFGAAILFVCAVSVAVLIGHARLVADLDARGVAAEATVVDVDEDVTSISPGGRVSRIDVTVGFTDHTGRDVRATQLGRVDVEVGDRLRVTYDPRDPGRVRWDGSGPHLVFDTILALLGPVLLLLLFVVPRTFVVPRIRDRRRRAGRPPPATEG